MLMPTPEGIISGTDIWKPEEQTPKPEEKKEEEKK